jgi:hypothetical protein
VVISYWALVSCQQELLSAEPAREFSQTHRRDHRAITRIPQDVQAMVGESMTMPSCWIRAPYLPAPMVRYSSPPPSSWMPAALFATSGWVIRAKQICEAKWKACWLVIYSS